MCSCKPTPKAGIEPFANGDAVGWVAKSEWPVLLPAHSREKIWIHITPCRVLIFNGIVRIGEFDGEMDAIERQSDDFSVTIERAE